MNRSALNSGPLGAGGALPWVTASASQTLQLAGSMTASVIKYAKASQSFALNGALRVTHRVAASASQSFALTGAMGARVLRQVRATATAFLQLDARGVAGVLRAGSATQGLRLAGACAPRVLRAVHGSAAQSLQLSGICTAAGFTTRPAPEERTAGAIDLMPRQVAGVRLGDD